MTVESPKPGPCVEEIQVQVCAECGGQSLRRTYTLDVPPVVIGQRDEIAATVRKHPFDIPLLMVGIVFAGAAVVATNHLINSRPAAFVFLTAWTLGTLVLGGVIGMALAAVPCPVGTESRRGAGESEHHRTAQHS